MQPFQQRIVVSLAACASFIVLLDQSGTAARSTAVPAQAAAAKQPAPKPAAPTPAGALDLKPYSATIPDTKVAFDMVPIPGGTFTMGSPAAEPGRAADEGPQVKVTVSPFYMSAHEVTWDEYDLFAFRKRTPLQPGQTPAPADAVTKPTPPYADETWGFGKGKQPAIGMTWHAAAEYCRWLSAKTGKLYRLPTEAEWEYAARAGTTTAWTSGADAAALDAVAWSAKNSESQPHPVAMKKPNAWGLFDMEGNVAEWTLDQYNAGRYASLASQKSLIDPVLVPGEARYPHVVRGGSFDDDPEKLRNAARRFSKPDWSRRDPQQPQSIWWHTDAIFVGFRIIEPVQETDALKGFRSKITRESPDQ